MNVYKAEKSTKISGERKTTFESSNPVLPEILIHSL